MVCYMKVPPYTYIPTEILMDQANKPAAMKW